MSVRIFPAGIHSYREAKNFLSDARKSFEMHGPSSARIIYEKPDGRKFVENESFLESPYDDYYLEEVIVH